MHQRPDRDIEVKLVCPGEDGEEEQVRDLLVVVAVHRDVEVESGRRLGTYGRRYKKINEGQMDEQVDRQTVHPSFHLSVRLLVHTSIWDNKSIVLPLCSELLASLNPTYTDS